MTALFGAAPGPGIQSPLVPPVTNLHLPQLDPSLLDRGLGALSYVGDIFDRPGNALRGLATGNLGGLPGMLPFSETLGLYDPKTGRTSGQDVLESLGIFRDEEDAGLWSPKGALGLGVEMAMDPLNLLPGFLGIKALTRGGQLAGKVGGHLDEVSALAKAMQTAGGDAAQAAGNVFSKADDPLRQLAGLEQRFGGKVLTDAGEALPQDDLLRMLGQRSGAIGADASYLLERGIAPKLAETAAERATGGQEALFSVGGRVSPLGLGPSIEIPQIDLLTDPTLQQGISDIFGMMGQAPGIKQLGGLFQRGPAQAAARGAAGLEAQLGRQGGEQVVKAQELFQAGRFEEAKDLLDPTKALRQDPKTQAIQQGAAEVAQQVQARGMNGQEVMNMAEEAAQDGTSLGSVENQLKIMTDAVEGGVAPEQVREFRNILTNSYKNMLDVESQAVGLKPLAGHYAPHITTKGGKGFFGKMAKDVNLKAGFINELNELLVSTGREPLKMAEGLALEKGGGRLSEVLAAAGMTDDVLEQAIHGSIHGRKYTATISEINEIAKKYGATDDVFEANPFKQLYARGLRHAKVQGAMEFVEGLNELKVGGARTASYVGAEPNVSGAVRKYDQATKALGKGTKGSGIVSSTPSLEARGVSQVVLDDGSTGFVADVVKGKGDKTTVFDTAKEAVEADKAFRYLQDDRSMSMALNFFDKATRLYKVALTRGFPAFHVRNTIENQIKSHMEGVPFLGKHNKLAVDASAGKDFSVGLGDGTTMTRDSMMAEFAAMPHHRILGSGQIESLMEEMVEKAKPSFNPLSPNSHYLRTLERFGAGVAGAPSRLATGNIDQVTKLDGAMIENTDKIRHYIYKRMEGFAPEDAAKNVMEAQFDYSKAAMNSFEREIADRTIMFYGYTRSVIPYIIQKAATESRKITPWLHMANHPGKDENLPPWLREGMSIPLGEDESGQMRILRSLGTPVEAAIEPFAGFEQGLQRGVAKLGSRLNPLLKAPIELLSAKDLFLGRDIDSLRKTPNWVGMLPVTVREALGIRDVKGKEGQHLRFEGDAWAMWVLRNSPVSRFSGTLSKGTDEKKAGWDIAGNLLTGSNITSFDPTREARYRNREAAIARLKELEAEGKTREIQNVYGATAEGRDDEEVRMLLNLLRGK